MKTHTNKLMNSGDYKIAVEVLNKHFLEIAQNRIAGRRLVQIVKDVINDDHIDNKTKKNIFDTFIGENIDDLSENNFLRVIDFAKQIKDENKLEITQNNLGITRNKLGITPKDMFNMLQSLLESGVPRSYVKSILDTVDKDPELCSFLLGDGDYYLNMWSKVNADIINSFYEKTGKSYGTKTFSVEIKPEQILNALKSDNVQARNTAICMIWENSELVLKEKSSAVENILNDVFSGNNQNNIDKDILNTAMRSCLKNAIKSEISDVKKRLSR